MNTLPPKPPSVRASQQADTASEGEIVHAVDELKSQVVQWFIDHQRQGDDAPALIGTEFECTALSHQQGSLAPPNYAAHIGPLLAYLRDHFGWSEGKDRGVNGEVVELNRRGASITLEPGGQIELSGAPLATLAQTQAELQQHHQELNQAGLALDLTFLSCGFHPFATIDHMNWMPKGRYAIMRDYLPTKGNRALDMMLRTTTEQVNLDYASEAQCGAFFRLANALSPYLTAIFANSPLYEGKPSPLQSQRSAVWTEVDNDRCGYPSLVFEQQFSFEKYIDWTLQVPMFFIKRQGQYIATNQPFVNYIKHGLRDTNGQLHRATFDDWILHSSTVFPEVRLKPFVEIRGADAPPAKAIAALPALCRALFYHDNALSQAQELLKQPGQSEQQNLWQEARTHGLHQPHIRQVCRELLAIAQQFLATSEQKLIEPIAELIHSGQSFGDQSLANLDQSELNSPTPKQLAKAFFYAGKPVE